MCIVLLRSGFYPQIMIFSEPLDKIAIESVVFACFYYSLNPGLSMLHCGKLNDVYVLLISPQN